MKFKSAVALLLATVMLLSLLSGCGKTEKTPETTNPSESSEEKLKGAYGENDVTALGNYAVLTAAPNDENMSAVIAVDADGEPVLTNGVMQIAYWLSFFNFMSTYGSYASYFGLDATAPLAGQTSMAENRTWEQYFLESASGSLSEEYSMYCRAKEDGFQLSEEDQKNIDDVTDPDGDLAKSAKEANYDSTEAYLQASFGPGVTLDDYVKYLTIYLTASAYYTSIQEGFQKETDEAGEEALSAYYDENAESFEKDRVQKVNNVTVRHILIEPTSADNTEESTATGQSYTDEEWAAAETTANQILEQWKQNPTEDNFAALAKEKSADPGTKDNGGLYEDFASNKMVEEFSDWCFDQTRQPGDTGVIKSSYGYHVMYFVKQTETKGWMTAVSEKMISEKMTNYIKECTEKFPLRFDYSLVRIFDLTSIQEKDNTDTSESSGSSESDVAASSDTQEASDTSN